MIFPSPSLALLLALPALSLSSLVSAAAVASSSITPYHDYRRAHSYSPSYALEARDGWSTVTMTDLPYKYANSSSSSVSASSSLDSPPEDVNRMVKRKKKDAVDSLADGVTGLAKGVKSALKAWGKAQKVIITWYTGYDLRNPSCWPDTDWAPTDQSMACALTMEGWTDRPQCFKFLELCNGPSKCVFVRIVDTCAGCKRGSRHVDLTKAAFSALADLDEGKLTTIKMRMASDPSDEEWDYDLWGPRM